MVMDNQWSWPIEWMNKFPILHNIRQPSLKINVKDKVLWVCNNMKKVQFSIKQTWEDLREDSPKVDWNHVVWYSQAIPKHSFILWLAIKGRLLTQDRILKWNPTGNYICDLCRCCLDSHEHLFFQCMYAKKVWGSMKVLLMLRSLNDNFGDIINMLKSSPYKRNIWSIIHRLVLGATVYYIWQERNCRIFKQSSRSDAELIDIIQLNVRLKLCELKVKNSRGVQVAARVWKLKWENGVLKLA
ncbi:uncharacterized protein [Rutidosis leptorrhynchoides]|uniref:uncharacterized protein n=1 Tax=Rutidosis leptorrhynchoides TaxID=125765 RepID=UPI003A99A9B4